MAATCQSLPRLRRCRPCRPQSRRGRPTLRPAARLPRTCTALGHDPGGAGAAPAAPADSCSPARRGAPFTREASTSGAVAPARVRATPWPSSTSSRPRLTRYAPRREHLHARRRPSIPEPVRGTHSRRGVSCERRSTDFGAHPRNRGQVLYTSQRTARPRGGALFPIQASCRVLRPRLDTRWHRGGDTRPDRIKEALPGTAPFFSMQAARSGIGTARRLLLRPVGRPRWRPPLSECALPRPSWRGVRPRYQKAPRQATFVSTVLLKHGRRPGCCSHAWRGALRLDQWPKRRARRPGTEQSRLNVKLLRGVSGPGAVPLLPDPRMAPRQAPLLLTRPDTIPPSYPPGAAPSFGSQRPRRRSPRDFTVTQSKE